MTDLCPNVPDVEHVCWRPQCDSSSFALTTKVWVFIIGFKNLGRVARFPPLGGL